MKNSPVLVLVAAIFGMAACGDDSGTGQTAATGSSASASSTGSGGAASGPLRLSFEEIAVPDDFALVTDMRFIPGTSELVATTWEGRLVHFRLNEGALELLGQ